MGRKKGRAQGARAVPASVDSKRPATPSLPPTFEQANKKINNRPSAKKPVSLRDEAQITQSRFTHADKTLRASHIAFVSAGTSSGEDLAQPIDTPKRSPSEASLSQSVPVAPPTESMEPIGPSISTLRPGNSSSYTSVDFSSRDNMASHLSQSPPNDCLLANDTFFVDVEGASNLVGTNNPRVTVRRSPSPADSISSEEVILFAGRTGLHSQNASPRKDPILISEPVPHGQGPHNVTHGQPVIHPARAFIQSRPNPSLPRSRSQRQRSSLNGESNAGLVSNNSKRARESMTERHAILADYVANIDSDDKIEGGASESQLWQRQLDTMNTDIWQAESDTSYSVTWDAHDMEAFEDLSTSNELLTEVNRILSKRERPSGIQYLVVPDGYTIDDARWMPVTLLHGATAQEKIRLYEIELLQLEEQFTTGGSDSEDNDDEVLARHLEKDSDDVADERDFFNRISEQMTDEQLARMLSKQEDFNLGSHDLLLYNGAEHYFSHDKGVQLSSDGRAFGPSSKSKRKEKSRLSNRFPSASLMADVLEQDPYNGFDIMDQDRPSLRKKVKGRKGKFPLELSDSEIEKALQSQWENDRGKKRMRQQEREEMRVQGLLGRNGKLNINAKYPMGMPLADIKDAVRVFLDSTDENLVLPSMTDKDRKMVHELANVFNLKSKSFGKGNNRFPVLYRTSRTLAFDEDLLTAKLSRMFSSRARPRTDTSGRKSKAATGGDRRGGFAKTAVSYRDGDIVGAAAPELGQDNKGRAMLEKMGWSTGTALGALNNKGIMQPVVHVVKNSKSGLG